MNLRKVLMPLIPEPSPIKTSLTIASRRFMILAGLLGAIGVALGAYASHGLSHWATKQQVEYFQLAVNYQLLHVITLLAFSIVSLFVHNRYLFISQIALVLGILLFSGSLYFYVFTGTKLLAMITPLGGLLLILGWLLFALSLVRK